MRTRARAASPRRATARERSSSRKPRRRPEEGLAPHGAMRGYAFRELALFATVANTAASFFIASSAGIEAKTASGEASGASAPYLIGLGFSGMALLGSTSVGAIRKAVSARGVGSADQVGVACLIQGVIAFAYCVHYGEIDAVPSIRFWWAATSASSLLVCEFELPPVPRPLCSVAISEVTRDL